MVYSDKTYVGDICLEDVGVIVERVHDDPPAQRTETTDVPGRHGTVLTGLTLEPRKITLECRCFCETWHEFDELKSTLAAAWVDRREMQMRTRNHPNEYYLVHFDSMSEGDREYGGSGVGALTLEFTADDPIRYGQTQTATISSSSNTSFTVGGTMPAVGIHISATQAIRNSSSQVWGIRFDDVDFLHIPIDSTTTKNVQIDCDARVARVAGTITMPTLDSNWPELAPGTRRARLDNGTGSAVLTWVERSI